MVAFAVSSSSSLTETNLSREESVQQISDFTCSTFKGKNKTVCIMLCCSVNKHRILLVHVFV